MAPALYTFVDLTELIDIVMEKTAHCTKDRDTWNKITCSQCYNLCIKKAVISYLKISLCVCVCVLHLKSNSYLYPSQ